MPRTAAVHVNQTKSGSWEVSTAALKPRYRRTWQTEPEAQRDAERIRRQLAGTGLHAGDLRAYEAAAHRLATTEAPGRGKGITFAVDWFLTNFVGSNSERTLKDWAKEYYDTKKLLVEEKSLREVQQYLLDHYVPEFGHLTPIQVGATQLNAYLAANTSRWHRDKVLRNFFSWLAGEECRGMATLEHAPLKISPFIYIVKTPYERMSDEVEVLYIKELRAAIELAIKEFPEVLGWLVFLALTGLRPDCEAPGFWTSDRHKWRKIDFTRKLLTVGKDLEKTKKRSRQLVLRPNVIAWLQYFQKTGTPMTCTRYAWRKFKRAAYPNKANVQDLLRHTAISNYAKVLSVFELEHQFATSKDMIFDHYLAMMTEEEVEEFFSFTPATFGLV